MFGRRAQRPMQRTISLLLVIVMSMTPGCWLPNGFLDPTKVGHFPELSEYTEVGIRRVLTARETPGGPANATEPTPEDLQPIYEEYLIGPGDVMNIVVDDLLRQGVQETAQIRVESTGFIRLPSLGSVKVAGLSEREIEAELKARLKSEELLPDPQVRVSIVEARQRVFNIIGSVTAAGQYLITDPDMRLLDAIGIARDIGPEVKKLHVIRRSTGQARNGPMNEPMDTGREGLVIPPPSEPADDYVNFSSSFGLGQEAPRGSGKGKARDEEVDDLLEILSPKKKGSKSSTTSNARRANDRPFAPLVYDPETGKPVEEKPESESDLIEKEVMRPDGLPGDPSGQQEFDWSRVAQEGPTQRVIVIDVGALRSGDARYNVVIRNRDVIEVPVDTGVFYMMGEINRPGVYALNGREVTIKQAIAIAGGFGPLAWPQRCEVIRREKGTDKQLTISVNLDAIFGGLADDVLLKDDDIINIGSHFVAPFLFVIRNSFRFTYGFGFVYDRNFADKDSFSGKANPEEVARARRQQSGLPF